MFNHDPTRLLEPARTQAQRYLAKHPGVTLHSYVEAAMLVPASFFAHYQLLRNLWHIADFADARLIFLLPKANERIWNDATTFRLRVAEPLRERVGVIAIEQVILSRSVKTLTVRTPSDNMRRCFKLSIFRKAMMESPDDGQ